MATNYLLVLVLAAVVAQGQSMTEIILEDRTTTFLSNPFISFNMGIAKPLFDKLVSCQVLYPDGVMYEAYPNDNLLHDEITFASSAVDSFATCSISMTNAPPSLSGTYELFSIVDNSDNIRTLTRQKVHVQFYFSDSWGVPQNTK